MTASQCSKRSWCTKGEGHPGDDPGTWSGCHSERLRVPLWAHETGAGSVYAESDGSEHFILIEHRHGDDPAVEMLMLLPAEVPALISQLQATLDATGGPA